MTNLTIKQRRFADQLLTNGGNATQAARDAGYRGSDRSLQVIGSENTRKPAVAAHIEADLSRNEITVDRVLAQLGKIAFAEWEGLVDERRDARGNVVSARLALADQVRALELVGKHLGMFREKEDAPREEVIRALMYIKPPGSQ